MNLTERDIKLLKSLLIGGSAIGGGIGLLQSGANYIEHLNQRARAKDKRYKDDDTLFLTVPAEKQASLGLGLGLAGGALATLATNALVKRLYQELVKRPELQAELDEAQRRHLQTAEMEAAQKQAAEGKPVSTVETLTSLPVALSLLTALASGALTYSALNKTFPGVGKPINPRPRRVKVLRQSAQAEEPAQEVERLVAEEEARDNLRDGASQMKEASLPSDFESGAWDKLAHMVLAAGGDTDVSDWVYGAASGRLQELEETVLNHGFDAACDMFKGASESPVSDNAIDLAVTYFTKSAALGPVFQLMVSAEICEKMPSFFKMAGALNPEDVNDLIGWLSATGCAERAARLMPVIADVQPVKEASDTPKSQREILRELLRREFEDESGKDRRTAGERLSRSQNINSSQSEGGDGDTEGGTADTRSDIPELVMGVDR